MKSIKKLLLSALALASSLIGAPSLPNLRNTRYETIKSFIKNNYTRPITILDLHADEHLDFQLSKKRDTILVLTNPDNIENFIEQCAQQDEQSNIMILGKPLSYSDIKRLGECEHFDITLALDLFDDYKQYWKDALKVSLLLGDHLIVAVPKDKQSQFIPHVEKLKGTLIGQDHKEYIYLFTRTKQYLARRRWNFEKSKSNEYKVESSFTNKQLVKNKSFPRGYTVTNWHPGINLLTFKILEGKYPDKAIIRDMLAPLENMKHNDMKIFNLIIQGHKLQPIDVNESGRNHNLKKELAHIINVFRRRRLQHDLESVEAMEALELKAAFTEI